MDDLLALSRGDWKFWKLVLAASSSVFESALERARLCLDGLRGGMGGGLGDTAGSSGMSDNEGNWVCSSKVETERLLR